MDRHREMKMGIKTMVSSARPQVLPQMEKNSMATGMIRMDFPFSTRANRPMPASMAFVSISTDMDPPTMKIKKMI